MRTAVENSKGVFGKQFKRYAVFTGMNIKAVENEISQAAELLESAYANIITQNKINAVQGDIDVQSAIKNLSNISSICKKLESEIREYSGERYL